MKTERSEALEAIAMISGHFETGAPLPASLLDALLAAKNFQSGMQMLRHIELALFDLEIHQDLSLDADETVQALLNRVRRSVSVTPVIPDNRFQNSFSHIFAGGYAAGYYSYKWAEVLSADAFRGRPPAVETMLRHSGLISSTGRQGNGR